MKRNQLVMWVVVPFVSMLAGCGDAPSRASVGSVPSLSDISLAAGADVTPPSAPSNLIWTNDGLTVTLTWGASTDDVGVAGYDLWYGNFFLGTFSDTTLSLIGFKPSTQYTFTVKARDAAGNTSVASNPTTVILAAPADTTPPSGPSNVRTTNVTSTSVSLAWNAASDDYGVVIYHVYSNGQIVANPSSTSATVTGLASSSSYTFTITAQDAAGNVSLASSPLSVTTPIGADTTPPSAPSGLVASNVTDTSVVLSWSASTDNVAVASYTVYNGSAAAATTSGLSASVTGLSPGTTYTFAVVAKDTSGNISNASNSVVVTTTSSYTLTITASSGGTTSPAAGTYSYPSGTTLSVTANPSSGYTLSAWSGAASGTSNPVSIVMTGNKTLTAAFTAVAPQSVSINVGGAATGTFVADEYFSGGTTYSNTNTIDTSAVGSVPAAVFQSERYGEFTYTVPNLSAGGSYIVTLYFAETYLSSAGTRVFDVLVNGTTALSKFDIYAAAGAQNKAVAQPVAATATSSGQVAIKFTTGTGGVENPKVCGIDVTAGVLPTYSLSVTKSGSGTGTVSGGGISCGNTCSVTASGTVTLTASPDSNSSFTSWGGACSGSAATCTVAMNAARSVTATFGGPIANTGPCDIYSSGGTPCVAAHSTVRALYGSYSGNLYRVRRSSDSTTKDIAVLAAGGFANTSVQNSFCTGVTCVITIVYDQSGKGNHLEYQGSGSSVGGQADPAVATKEPLSVGGHQVYSLYIQPGNSYWRDGHTTGIPTGAAPEGIYMVTSGTHVNNGCCFDYGNSETDRKADGAGAMDAINFGTECWFGGCTGGGPWVQADLEYGLFPGGSSSWNSAQKSFSNSYVTAMLKNNGTTAMALKGANAQSGSLSTLWNGGLPSGYNPMKKQGAIILGSGGDCCATNRNQSQGTFYEGAIVAGYPSDTTDSAIQSNIVSAGYGH
jgi:chitodextrinase